MNNSLEREFENQVFSRQQQLIEERRKRMLDRVMRRLAAQGIEGSGIGTEILQREVEEPIAQAEAGLDWMRLQQMEKRRAELEAERQRKSGFWGRVAGGAISGLLGAIPGVGQAWSILNLAKGAGIGAAGGFMGGGGGETQTTGSGGYNSMYMQAFQEWLDKLDQKQASFAPYMGY